MILALLIACDEPPPPTPMACRMLDASAAGPLASERHAAAGKAVDLARLFIREARQTSDPGFYTLAAGALDCAVTRNADDREALRLRAHVELQFHNFAAVEVEAARLVAMPDATWLDHALLGDAQMERGRLEQAGAAYQAAADLRPGLEVYDRVGWLRWLWGDVEGSLEMAKLAVATGTPADPEPYAWVLTRLGWLHALACEPAPELDQALALLPGYAPAAFARGRVRLHTGDHVGAAADLRAVGATVEAAWGLSELDATVSVAAVREQDARGYAMWLAPSDPLAARTILDAEWVIRQDATTRMARAWAAWLGRDVSIDAAAEARIALATGIVEPRVLRMGSQILGDEALMQRALSMGPGLLPSERAASPAPGAPASTVP